MSRIIKAIMRHPAPPLARSESTNASAQTTTAAPLRRRRERKLRVVVAPPPPGAVITPNGSGEREEIRFGKR